jgi:hypothetical protein
MILIAQSWINLHDVFWNAGMLEYWNIGLKIGIGLCFIYAEMPFDQENPVIHYSIIPLFQYPVLSI